ncbi:hypothetical protein LVD15_06140 [Fulvivirga maritima]|uniref:hypothetical protein n=1 Tax=Fulvivirga maritima TaxID=2904247 RepID=UPI001F419F53|nr:hypothetical protein [Fulvivirga maritima]UII28001.1 hypothetical protein LVD15_06140 [Fulvivirga maritima]
MKFLRITIPVLLLFTVLFTSCSDDDVPEAENEEEVINKITLTFTPAQGGDVVTATYLDPDGEGTEPATQEDIVLQANTEYELTMSLKNTVGDENEEITDEINEESDAHMFFFGFTEGLFTDPQGTGNIGAGNRNNDVNYEDVDVNALPVGLITSWTTGDAASGDFRIVLKHQPNLKSQSTTTEDGLSDVDLTWNIEVE